MVSKLKPTFVTDEFISAVADSLATGNAITLTTAVASATTYTDTQLSGLNYAGSQSATKNLTTDLNSAVVKADTNTIVIDVDLVNQNLNADFQISTVLINGTYKGANILVGVVRFETPELFPAYDNISIYELEMKLYISVSRIAYAKINVNSAGMATAKSVQDLRTYVDGDFNADIARKTKDNIFTGTNTFNKKIIAPAGVQGNADTATKLQTARRINGTTFDGTSDINVNAANDSNLVHRTGNENIAGIKSFSEVLRVGTGSFSGGALEISAVTPYIDFHFNNDTGDYTSRIVEEASGTLNVNGVRMKSGVITGSLTGNADTSTKLQTARLVGGVSFDGTSDIVLPGVNAKGNQDTSGRAANATNADRANSAASADIANKAVALNTPRKINGTNFDGTADINVNAANDSNLVHRAGNENIAGDKVFTDNNTFTQQIFGSFKTRPATFTDFANVASDMVQYAGLWYVNNQNMLNSPVSGVLYGIIEVIPAYGTRTGVIRYSDVPNWRHGNYVTTVDNGKINGWEQTPDNATVVHNTGNETIAGTKNFTGNAIFNNLIDGYTKTSVAPNTDVNLITNQGKYVIDSSYTNIPLGMPNQAILIVENNVLNDKNYQIILSRDVDGLTNGDVDMFLRLRIDYNWTPWRKLAQDQQVLHLSGDETAAGFKKFSGNIATTSDNSMINGGGNNGDIALVKKSGTSGALIVGKNNSFAVKQSANASILPTDTHTTFFNVNTNGTIYAGTQQDLVPLDKNVVHKTGAETIAGAKAFTDRAVFDKAIYGKFESRILPDGTDLYTLIENNVFYLVPTYAKSQTIVNKPSEVQTAFGIMAADVGGYQQNSYAATSLLLFEYGSGKMFIASLQANGQGVITVAKKWTKIATDDSLLVHNTGTEDILGNKNFKNPVTAAGIEIMADTPFVDFHFGNDSGDYTSRIAEYVKGELNINSVKLSGGTISGTLNGNASSATKLQTARNINGVAFDGTSDITIDPALRIISTVTDLFTLENGFYLNTGVASTNKPASSNWFVVEVIRDNFNGFMRLIDNNGLSFWNTKNGGNWGAWHQDADDATVVHNSGNETIGGSKTFSSIINGNLNGNSSTATKLQTARTIGGVAFDGSANINLPGVNTTGNQNTTGNAATATKLQFVRKINGVLFDGSGDISVNAANDSNLVHKDGNDNITGTLTVSGTANLTGQVNFITRTITWNSGILQGTWNIQRVGKWVSAKLDFPTIPYTSGTGTTTLALPSGFTPSSTFTRELEQGEAGMRPDGKIFVTVPYKDANGMTFHFPTNDAFPSA